MALPMALLGTLIFGSFLKLYDEELIASRQNSLQQTQAVMDNIVKEMESNASILLNSSNFKTSYIKEKYGNFYDITRQLASITYTNTFVETYYYLNSDLELIFSPDTMFSYDRFINFGLKNDSLQNGEVEELLLQNKIRYWLPVEKDQITGANYISYIFTDKTGKNAPENSIVFLINQYTINEIMGITSNSYLDFAMICSNNSPIYYSDDSLYHEISNIINEDNGTYYEKQQINDKTYMIFYSYSPLTELKYIYAVPYDTLTAPIHNMQQSFFITLLIVSILCSGCILYFMNNIYHPVQQMSNLINNIFNNKSLSTDSEQFESARRTLSQIQKEKNEQTQRKILLRLLRGEFQNLEELELATNNTDLEFFGDCFSVLLLQIHTNGQMLNSDIYRSIEEFWTGSLSVEVNVHFLAFPESTSMVLISAGDKENYQEFYHKLYDLKLMTENRLSFPLTIGVGEEQPLCRISESYYQARKASQYQLFQKDNGLIFFKDIQKAEQWKGMYPTLEIQNLHHAIEQADKDCISLSLQTLLNDVLRTGSLIYCNLIMRDILITVIKVLQEMQCNTDELATLSTENISDFHNSDELQRFFNQIEKMIEKALQDKTELLEDGTAKQEPIQEILEFVNQHFYEESLSVKMVADHFGMTVSNLSHYFKKYTNETISEYIALLRFNKAKELLRDTDIVLSEICLQCGYLHLSTFMRQFKAREGCTPSVYRSQYRKTDK